MKFLFADSQDRIDPGYDFARDDRRADGGGPACDQWPHQYFGAAGQQAYDGLLVSYEIVAGKGKKYGDAQAQRLRAEGAPAFFGFDAHPRERPIFGDCGAFAYADQDVPPYEPAQIARFYAECRFTHGISVDHIIFAFTENDAVGPTTDEQRRYDVTIANARRFRKAVKDNGYRFVPVAPIQGWNPASMARAARTYVKMGYDYVAIGGLVPLKVPQIRACIQAVREAAPEVKIHLLGVTKPDHIHEFIPFGVTTFDSTSPLIRAFKDARHNYWSDAGHYTSIRVPQAGDNAAMKRRILAGRIPQDVALQQERWALERVRAIDALPTPPTREEVDIALEDILLYNAYLDEDCDALRIEADGADARSGRQQHLFARSEPWQFGWDPAMTAEYRRTLLDRPWKACPCRVCREAGPEVILFRGSNRNKRRGFHNLWWFYQRLQAVIRRTASAVAPPSARNLEKAI